MSRYHNRPQLVMVRSKADRKRHDADVKREYEYWLRTLTDDEHRAALAKYRQLMARFPGLLIREGYIAAARMVRRV